MSCSSLVCSHESSLGLHNCSSGFPKHSIGFPTILSAFLNIVCRISSVFLWLSCAFLSLLKLRLNFLLRFASDCLIPFPICACDPFAGATLILFLLVSSYMCLCDKSYPTTRVTNNVAFPEIVFRFFGFWLKEALKVCTHRLTLRRQSSLRAEFISPVGNLGTN